MKVAGPFGRLPALIDTPEEQGVWCHVLSLVKTVLKAEVEELNQHKNKHYDQTTLQSAFASNNLMSHEWQSQKLSH